MKCIGDHKRENQKIVKKSLLDFEAMSKCLVNMTISIVNFLLKVFSVFFFFYKCNVSPFDNSRKNIFVY